jgi:hypothetical protein
MTTLTDNDVNLINRLAVVKDEKNIIQSRIKVLESKLASARDASLNLVKEEQDIVNTLQNNGYIYGQRQESPKFTLPTTQEQLTMLLSTLLQQQQPFQHQPQQPQQPFQHTMSPASGTFTNGFLSERPLDERYIQSPSSGTRTRK